MRQQDSIMILDLVDSGVIMLDKEGRVLFWNQFISQASHIEFSSIEGKPLLDVFPSITETRISKAVDKAIELNFPSILSYKLLKNSFPLYRKSLATKPPYLIVQSIIVKPIVENGENNGCIIYINDVSAASKREEDLIRQSDQLKQVLHDYEKAQNQYQQLFESARSGIVVFDEQGCIEHVNESAAKIFNLDGKEIVGKKIDYFLPSINQYFSYDSGVYSLVSIKTIENYIFEEQIKIVSPKYLTVSINKISEHENKFFVYINDVTNKKIIEQRLLTANTELEEFAYRTSHDLRSPVISSIGLLDVARKGLKNQDVTKVEQCLDLAQKSLKKLEILIRDILSLTEAKNGMESNQEIDLDLMIQDAFDSINQLQGFDKINCRINLHHTQPLISDKKRVNMILENLLSNAVKYHDPNQEHSYISIESKYEDNHFVLSVSDNGLGIPASQKENLFKMFNRFHPKVAFGSGLGLYLMKKSAEVIGGDVQFVEQPIGTQFQLIIPQTQQETPLH